MIDLSKPTTRTQLFEHAPTGSEVHFDWRIPTTSELQAHSADSGRFYSGRETKDKDFPMAYGLAVLTGIRDGEWSIAGKAISSDPGSPDFRADWKDLLAQNDLARQFIVGLASVAFNGVMPKSGGVEKNEAPFPKS